jgi:hypothetical protein
MTKVRKRSPRPWLLKRKLLRKYLSLHQLMNFLWIIRSGATSGMEGTHEGFGDLDSTAEPYKSSGVSPVRFAIRFSMTGPISSLS